MTDDEQFSKWGEWIMVIHEEVENAILNRHIRQEIAAIIDANPRIQRPSAFYEWMAAVYSDSGLMAVRRQIDKDPQSFSLVRLLCEIVKHPRVLSRDFPDRLTWLGTVIIIGAGIYVFYRERQLARRVVKTG